MALVQQTALKYGAAAATSATTAAFASDTTAGNYVIVTGSLYSGSGLGSVTVSDNKGNTYATDVELGNGVNCWTWIASAKIATGGSGHTVTVTAPNSSEFTFGASEFSELAASSVLDQTGSDAVTSTETSSACNTSATTQANELIIAVCGIVGSDSDVNFSTPASSGYTSLYLQDDANTYGPAIEASYKIVSSTGVQSASWTFDSISSGGSSCIATFKSASSAVKFMKLLAHSSAAGASSVAGTVFEAPTGSDITGAKIGEFTAMSFLGANSLDGGKAKLLVNVASFGGGALTTANTPHVYVRTSSFDTGIVPATVIEV